MKDLECPYCGEWCDVNHDDELSYQEDYPNEMECEHCENNFIFYTHTSFSYSSKKADCLNGENHDYKPTHTYPRELTQMMCTACGEKREFTNDERIEFFKKIK